MFLVIFVFFLWTEYISQVSIRYVTTVHSKFFFSLFASVRNTFDSI